jgi:hypothetical protein
VPDWKSYWRRIPGVRWVIALAVLLSVGALTNAIATRAGRDRAVEPEWSSRELGTLASIGQQRRLTARDADELVRIFRGGDAAPVGADRPADPHEQPRAPRPAGTVDPTALATSRTALATIAELLGRDDVRMDRETRLRLEGVLIGALDHGQWRIRSTALAGCGVAGLTRRPDVRGRIAAMRNDPAERVATLAGHIIDELEEEDDGG